MPGFEPITNTTEALSPIPTLSDASTGMSTLMEFEVTEDSTEEDDMDFAYDITQTYISDIRYLTSMQTHANLLSESSIEIETKGKLLNDLVIKLWDKLFNFTNTGHFRYSLLQKWFHSYQILLS